MQARTQVSFMSKETEMELGHRDGAAGLRPD